MSTPELETVADLAAHARAMARDGFTSDPVLLILEELNERLDVVLRESRGLSRRALVLLKRAEGITAGAGCNAFSAEECRLP